MFSCYHKIVLVQYGTHLTTSVESHATTYRDRNNYASQNMLTIVDFDQNCTYVLDD